MSPMKSEGASKIRGFIAIDISGEVRKSLDAVIHEMKPRVPDVRWVRVKGVHLTLKFLGNINERDIPSVTEIIRKVAISGKPFNISVKGLGAFPNPRRARVVWAGVYESTGTLEIVASDIDKGLTGLGFEPETRAFHPHLTLGRAAKGGRPGKELEGLIERDAGREFGSFTADEIILFKSDLRPSGAVYTKLETVKIGD